MKALVYDSVQTLVYRDMPDPIVGAGQSLIRIEASGICGGFVAQIVLCRIHCMNPV